MIVFQFYIVKNYSLTIKMSDIKKRRLEKKNSAIDSLYWSLSMSMNKSKKRDYDQEHRTTSFIPKKIKDYNGDYLDESNDDSDEYNDDSDEYNDYSYEFNDDSDEYYDDSDEYDMDYSDENDINDFVRKNEKIYPGSFITVQIFTLLFLSIIHTLGLSKLNAKILYKFILIILPTENICPKSYYLLLKNVISRQIKVNRNCSHCEKKKQGKYININYI